MKPPFCACLSGCLLMTALLGDRLEAGSGGRPRLSLTAEQSRRIGQLVWKNECGGTVSGLTSWNKGEEFPSLGIGHFIWYPAGHHGPFQESFPALLEFVSARGARLPDWLQSRPPPPCPWRSREEFLADHGGARLGQLRRFLVATFDLQVAFLVARQEEALPKMLEKVAPARRAGVEAQFYRVASRPLGPYALIDYVNFKGEGVLETERYSGEGWGLLQVLEAMEGTSPDTALDEFVRCAKARLKLRVKNSPPARNEARWLPGWCKRLDTYLR